MKRSCQRQTQVFDLPVRRMISLVPTPSARQQNDLGAPDMLLRGVAIPSERCQTAAVTGGESDGNSGAHAAKLARDESAGNPLRDSNVRFDPLGDQLGWRNVCKRCCAGLLR